MYCLFYAKQHNIDVVRVRFQNVYGPREILGAGVWRGTDNTIWRNVIPTFIYKSIHNHDINIYGQNRASRDFIYIEDLINGIRLAMEKGSASQVYNLASGIELNILELAKLIVKLTNSKSIIHLQSAREWDNSGRRVGNILKSERELAFKTSTKVVKGLQQTIKWTYENLEKIEKTISQHNVSRNGNL
jgi:nucleoside-diphosphate-sugar epimerase